jgi:hypothetical protein
MLLLKVKNSLRLTLMWLHNITRVISINILCHQPLKVKRNKTIFLQKIKIIKPVLMLWIHINRKMIEKPARMKYQPMIRGRKQKCKTLKIAGNKPMRIQNLMHY